MKKKVLCYIADFKGCGYYRIWLPYMELHKRGLYDVKISTLVDPNELMKADIVVFQRQHHDPTMNAILTAKKFKKIVISENDDYLENMPYYNPGEDAEIETDQYGLAKVKKSHFSKDSPNIQTLRRVYQVSNALSVTTKTLSSYHENLNSNIFILPNFIDGAYIRKTQLADQPTFVYAAAGGRQGDLDLIGKVVKRFMKEVPNAVYQNVGIDYRLYLIGNISTRTVLHRPAFETTMDFLKEKFLENNPLMEHEIKEWRMLWEWDGWNDGQEYVIGMSLRNGQAQKFKIDPIHWDVLNYYDSIHGTGAHIGIAPLCQNEFNAAKSWLKVLEYAMHGIPSVASNFAQYSELISGIDPYRAKHTANAFCMGASDNSQWIKALKMLTEDLNLQRRMSDSALEFAKLMTIQNNINIWDNMLQSLCEVDQAA